MTAFDGKGGVVHLDDVPAEEVAGEPRLPHAVQDLGAAAGATVAAARRVHLAGDALVPAFATLAGPAPAEEFALVLAGSGRVELQGPDGPPQGGWPLRPGLVVLRRGGDPPPAYRADEDGLDLLLLGAHVAPKPPFDGAVAVTALVDVELETLDKGVFVTEERDLGRALGSTLCGVRHEVMPPGAWSCPPHWHGQEHELFHVLEGDGELLLFGDDGTQREAVPIRAGHLVSRPAATGVAHALRAGGRGLTYLAFGTREPGEVVFYPRSRKAYLGPLLVRVEPVADYWDGEL
jgi:uncharacterized cupin superfamily protein